MTPERLARFLAVRPFRRFVLHIADGRALEVEHPEMAALVEPGRSLVVTTPDDSSHLIDMFLITGIEVPTASDWEGMIEGIA